jgi:hypothetical protein
LFFFFFFLASYTSIIIIPQSGIYNPYQTSLLTNFQLNMFPDQPIIAQQDAQTACSTDMTAVFLLSQDGRLFFILELANNVGFMLS